MGRLTRAGIVAEAGRTPEEVDEAVRQLTGGVPLRAEDIARIRERAREDVSQARGDASEPLTDDDLDAIRSDYAPSYDTEEEWSVWTRHALAALNGGTSPGASARRRKQVTQLTLGYVTRARLEEIAARWGTMLTGAVERLVLEAEMPRR